MGLFRSLNDRFKRPKKPNLRRKQDNRHTAFLSQSRETDISDTKWGAPEMGMSEKARELRRCQGIRKDGGRCQCFACWGDEFCNRHGGVKTAKAVCTCIAYNWPHRPGGGYCEWPDHPRIRLTTPAGTKAEKIPRWMRRISVRNGWNDVSGYK